MKYFLLFLVSCFLAGLYIDRIPVRLRRLVVPVLCLFIIVAFFFLNKV
jgi:hypothetical protein